MLETKLVAPVAGAIESLVKKFGKEAFIQKFTLPGGDEQDFLLWRVPETQYPSIVFPVTNDLEVIALQHFRFGANRFMIEVPGGIPKPGEAPEVAAARELLEETGYEASEVIRLAPRVWFEPAACRVPYFPILAVGCHRVAATQLEATEVAEQRTYPLQVWMEMIRSGVICDGKTVTLTMLALIQLGFLNPEQMRRHS